MIAELITKQKYYLMVYLVEVSTVDQLVDRLKKGKFRTIDDIKVQSESSNYCMSAIAKVRRQFSGEECDH